VDPELVPPPAGGRVFVHAVAAGLADAAPSGRVRLDAIARWLQDAAYADVLDAELHEEAIWVLRRTRLEVARFPRFGEPVTLRTWCSGIGRMWAQRSTTVEGAGGARAAAVALWVHLDPAGTRPAPFSEREIAVYGPSAVEHGIKARLLHPGPDGDAAPAGTWTFRASDLDLLDHVNNAAYWQVLEERLIGSASEPEPLDAEIEYRMPAAAGTVDLAERDGLLWLRSGDEVLASIRAPAPRP
jgi:acyl-ACP thioesterase